MAATGVRLIETRAVAAKRGGRAATEEVAGSESLLEVDVVIQAFGFRPSPADWLAQHGVALTDDGRVRVEGGLPYQTSNPKIFAGGDNVRGADLVVTAVHDGREAGEAIARRLLAPAAAAA